jgi:hypothetical protein
MNNNNTETKYKAKRSTSITRFRHRCRQMFDSARQVSIKRLVFIQLDLKNPSKIIRSILVYNTFIYV